MTQLSFATLDHRNKKKQTKRERFLSEMDAVVPWAALDVTSRVIVGSFFEELRVQSMPVFERVDRRTPLQHGLGELGIIEADVA